MKKLILLGVIAAFGLAACGVKGPLYLPAKAEQPAQSQTQQ